MPSEYVIPDEPKPSTLSRATVNPFFPMLAIMLAGSWLAFPWFAFNGFAMGSAWRVRELMISFFGFVGGALLVIGVLVLVGSGVLPKPSLNYLLIIPTVWKLIAAYWLFTLQSRSFALYEYYAANVVNGLPVVLIGAFLGWRLIESGLSGSTWNFVLLLVLR